MNRTVQSIVVVAGLLAFLLATPAGTRVDARALAGPDATARIGFSQDVYDVTVGDDFSVVMIVEDADALGGWETVLAYDPAVVGSTALSAGGFLTAGGREAALLGPDGDPGSGQVALGGYSWDPTGGIPHGVSGGGELARLDLHAVAVGQSVLALSDTATLLASVHATSVTPQYAEQHTALVNVYAAPSAPEAAPALDGSQVEITWHVAANTSYQMWRSTSPYFVPGEGDSIVIADYSSTVQNNCSLVGETITCFDPYEHVVPGTFFYIVQSLNPAGATATSRCIGAFIFPIQGGS